MVSALIYLGHRHWLAVPAKCGKPHNDNSQRKVRIDDISTYEDSWTLLNSDDGNRSMRVPEWVYAAYG
jgi:hypothetical protein